MSKYIIRLDDACEKRDINRWNHMENLWDKYQIKPLVGVIPDCKDSMMEQYTFDKDFWNVVQNWTRKGWTIALHGYQHVYTTNCGGLNPVNPRSEFAGETFDVQKIKIKNAVEIMRSHGIEPEIFFAPSHTFDENTLNALKEESNIRIISDTVANKPYSAYGITFVPQQSGMVRKLPFNTVTFCYHPNTMKETDFEKLEIFIKKFREKFTTFPMVHTNNKLTVYDKMLRWIYYIRRR